jgi:hypothetical protein
MMFKRAITIILGVFIISSIAYAFIRETKSSKTSSDEAELVSSNQSTVQQETSLDEALPPVILASDDLQPDRIQVYYFHRRIRCTGCITVEQGSFEAVSEDHQQDIADGVLEWHSINFDEPENEHFATEYDLYSQELVLIEIKDNEIIRHAKIPEVWEHWSDKGEIRSIVNEKIDEWLGGIS